MVAQSDKERKDVLRRLRFSEVEAGRIFETLL